MAVPKLQPLLRDAINREAKRLDIPPAALAAVVAVESGGRLSARVAGRDEPLIRFEGHYFDRRLAGRARAIAREAGLADPRAGRIKNPRGQEARWSMLKRAASIHHVAAHESCSWGCGQVMGAHWRWLGYPSVDVLVAEARNGIGGQVRLMGRFIEKTRLDEALRREDFKAFAKGYNGPAYAKNAYDRRMADAFTAYDRLFGGSAADKAVPTLLRVGAQGQAVRQLQADLVKLGHDLRIDGVFGVKSKAAVQDFQSRNGLAADGVVGPRTRAKLDLVLAGQAGWNGAYRRSAGWALLTLLYAILRRVFGRVRLD